MNRFTDVSGGRRIGIAALALLLATSLAWAASYWESLDGATTVEVGISGASTIQFGSGQGGEGWIEFSIDFEDDGDIYIDGEIVGTMEMTDAMTVDIALGDGVAKITVTDVDSGTLLWMGYAGFESVDAVQASGDVYFLFVD